MHLSQFSWGQIAYDNRIKNYHFLIWYHFLPTTQFAYQKGLGTCNALLCVSHTLQSALESGQEARIVQINFSTAFDRVNHQGILYRLSSVGIGGSVLSVPKQFLSNRSQYVLVDGCMFWSNWSTLCQEWRRAVFWARCCSFCKPQNLFPFWRISLLLMLTTPLWWLLCHPQAL